MHFFRKICACTQHDFHKNIVKVCVYSPHRVARVVSEVDFGKSHMNDQYFHAHNAALIAVLVLGNNGHLGLSYTLFRRENKILLS